MVYLREVAAYPIMAPSEELEAALAIENSEIDHWVALLSYPPVVKRVLSQLFSDIQSLPVEERPGVIHLEHLREMVRHHEIAGAAPHQQQFRWESCSRLLGQAVRLPDTERIWVAHANAVARAAIRDQLREARSNAARSECQAFVKRVLVTAAALRATKNRFIAANLRLVLPLARQYGRGGVPLMDAIQDGNVGLIKAVDRFDHRRGYRFGTFALWWIRHEISHAVAERGRTVRVPEHLLAECAHVARAGESLLARNGRVPTSAELAELTQLPQNKVETILTLQLTAPVSLDRDHGGELPHRLTDFLADANSASQRDLLMEKNQIEILLALLGSLSPDDACLVRWRFGFQDDELTFEELATRYHLSREGIRRRLLTALRVLRRKMRQLQKQLQMSHRVQFVPSPITRNSLFQRNGRERSD